MTLRSAVVSGAATVSVTLDMLFAGLGSLAADDTVAVFVNGPGAEGAITWMDTPANALGASRGMVQMTVELPLHEPPKTFVCASTNVTPGGSASVTITGPTVSGPLLVMVRL